MTGNKHGSSGKERFSLLLVTIVLIVGFFSLHQNQKKVFDDASSSLVLQKGMKINVLSDALIDGNYISNITDAQLIARHIVSKLDSGVALPNLGALNKNAFRLSADSAFLHGGAGLKKRVEHSRENLGIDDEVKGKYNGNLTDSHSRQSGDCYIQVKVQQVDKKASRIMKMLKKNYKPADSVLVRLKEHFYIISEEKTFTAADSVLHYAMTGKNGVATFSNLNREGYYSVLPVKVGFEYGSPNGTRRGSLKKNHEFTFTQRQHQIAPFDALTYSQIKGDHALTVRSPEAYNDDMIMYFAFFLIAWWALHVCLAIRNRQRKIETDNLLLPVLMTLSGLCLLTMYATANPLSDIMYGNKMAKSAIIGIVLVGILTEIDFVNFFSNNLKIKFDFVRQFFTWLSTPFTQKISRMQQANANRKITIGRWIAYQFMVVCSLLCYPFEIIMIGLSRIFAPLRQKQFAKLPDGYGYVVIAIGLMALLYLFGDGPEGSGAKVNLFRFQPSEVTKYLLVFFLSSFFCKNAKMIQAFSDDFNKTAFGLQIKTVIGALVTIVFVFGIYLGVLSDGGPALVLVTVFILIYSVARRDLWQLLFGVLSFIVFLEAGWQLNKTMPTLFIAALLWIIAWFVFWYVREKKLYESAIFMNLLIALFLFGGPVCEMIGLTAEGQRLKDRNAVTVWAHNDRTGTDNGVWNNEIKGGNQVVNGIWALASGGFSGQGLGKGNPNVIPASNTDMVFASIGEELGFAALALILLCMAVLLHRSLLLAMRAGNTFAFFLMTGIAVVTGVQFAVIVLGSIGLIPLTGISVPFLSFGGSSMIINLAAFGIVLSLSRERVTEHQAREINKYNNVVDAGAVAYIGVSLTVLGALYHFMVSPASRDRYLIKYAAVTNMQGARTVEYNPRIHLLMKKLHAGNIYDRAGMLLATNEKALLQDHIDEYVKAGVGKNVLNGELKMRKERYYPFGNHLFFMLGDFNTKTLWSSSENEVNPYGYMAENRHLAALRGIDNLKKDEKGRKKMINLSANKYRQSPFIAPQKVEGILFTDFDYSALLPMLKAGLNSRAVENWNRKRDRERNVTLTIDAALQTKMQNTIEKYVINVPMLKNINKLRISVVVLNALSGELLCSANWPLPDQDTLRSLIERRINVYDEKDLSSKAYTERDLGLTFQTAPGSTAKVMSALAGLKQMGVKAAGEKYYVHYDEIIEKGRVNEPHSRYVSMEDAIVISSNCYFINLVHDHKLYPQLDSIYSVTGIRINKNLSQNHFLPLTPYFFHFETSSDIYKNEIKAVGAKAVHTYEDYIAKRKQGRVYEKMSGYAANSRHDWNGLAWAWGQGSMLATPLNMARAVSIVASGGNFVPTRYIHDNNKNRQVQEAAYAPIPIVSKDEAGVLRNMMIKEAMEEQRSRNKTMFSATIGGKTGTPERDLFYSYDQTGKPVKNRRGEQLKLTRNDGWYVFFTDSEKQPLAVAVRMERLPNSGSGAAVRLSDEVVMKVLTELGYIE